MYRNIYKRLLDLVITGPVFLVLFPFMVLLGIFLYIFQDKSVLFTQLRPGLHEQLFTIYKFKTMTNKRDLHGNLLPDAQRLTRIGRFIRKYSLDELPQLWNVLKGDLSLVGPRPLLPEYLELYTPEQARRHFVKPGITGWAQVNGRNAISWEQKFKYDVWYVYNVSLWVDLKIIGRTFLKILNNADTQAPGSATADRFTGTLPHAS